MSDRCSSSCLILLYLILLCCVLQSFIGLGIFWVALFATSAAFVVQYKNDQTEKIPKASKREDE